MKSQRANIAALNFLAYGFLVCGIGGTIADIVSRWQFSFPFNLGIVLGNGAFTAAGLLSTMAAASLRDFDRRLRAVEEAYAIFPPDQASPQQQDRAFHPLR